MSEFLAMGGYGAFIWPAFGVSAVLLGGAAVLTMRAWRRARARLAALEKP